MVPFRLFLCLRVRNHMRKWHLGRLVVVKGLPIYIMLWGYPVTDAMAVEFTGSLIAY